MTRRERMEFQGHLHKRPYSLSVSYAELSALERILHTWRQGASASDVADRNATADLAKRLTSMRSVADLLEKQ